MAALAQQLEQLKLQQEELKKKIQEEEERKIKLNNEASIERLEALVQPITETLDFVDPNNHNNVYQAGKSQRIQYMERLKHDILVYNQMNLEQLLMQLDEKHHLHLAYFLP